MALYNKNECLENTFFSICNQKSSFNYNLCFIDDASDESPLPLIKKYFNEKDFIFKQFNKNNRIGFQNLRKEFLKILPKKTSIIIWQSCDVIWADDKLLEKMISAMVVKSKYKYKSTNYKLRSVICVPKKINNYIVRENLHSNGKGFHKELINLKRNSKLRGHNQVSKYLYLGALRREDFAKAVRGRLYDTYSKCDMLMREALFERLKIPLVEVDSEVFHQKHIATIAKCTSIDSCTHPCKVRRRMIARDMKLPWVIGFYNFNTKKWDNHPSKHYKRFPLKTKTGKK
jgi:hypothetical protein